MPVKCTVYTQYEKKICKLCGDRCTYKHTMRKPNWPARPSRLRPDQGRNLRVGLMTMQKIRLSTAHTFGATNIHDAKAQAKT